MESRFKIQIAQPLNDNSSHPLVQLYQPNYNSHYYKNHKIKCDTHADIENFHGYELEYDTNQANHLAIAIDGIRILDHENANTSPPDLLFLAVCFENVIVRKNSSRIFNEVIVNEKNLNKVKEYYLAIHNKYPNAECRLIPMPLDGQDYHYVYTMVQKKLEDFCNNLNIKLQSTLFTPYTKDGATFKFNTRASLSCAITTKIWHEKPEYKKDRKIMEEIWNQGIKEKKTPEKIIHDLLSDYLQNNSMFGQSLGRFFAGYWSRNHIDEINKIFAEKDGKNAQALLDELKNIDLIDAQDTCANLIEFLEGKIQSQAQVVVRNGTKTALVI